MISEKLERLVEEMVDRGVMFEDAMREFEKRFIARVLGRCEGSLTKTADVLGIQSNTHTRKMGVDKYRRRKGKGLRPRTRDPRVQRTERATALKSGP